MMPPQLSSWSGSDTPFQCSNPAWQYPTSNAEPGMHIPTHCQAYANGFKDNQAQKLPPHRSNVDHRVPLVPSAKSIYGSNLSELELKTLENFILIYIHWPVYIRLSIP